ncbi:MAG: MFS transporter [Candidatus Limnocylindrales bacterium]|nr:MFS transporter [Candidatus Limnocylindrales bacterium]
MSEATVRLPSDWRRGFVIQLVVAGLAATAMHASRPTMTYRALSLGATPLEIGLIQSAFSIVPALTAVAIGRWIDRVGESRYLMVSLGTLTAGSLVATFAPGLVVLAITQIALGLGQIIYLVASQSQVANHGPREGREARFGHYSTVTSLGQLAGPAIAAAIIGGAVGAVALGGSALLATADTLAGPPPSSPAGFFPGNREAGVFLFAGFVTLVACGLAFLIPTYPRRPLGAASTVGDGRQPGVFAMAGQVLRRQGMVSAMFVSMTVISAVDVLVAYMPAYGEDVGLSVALVGVLLSVRAGASLVSRFFMSQLIRWLGRSRLLALSMLMAGGGLIVMPFVTSPAVLVAIMVVVGLGLGLGQPMTIAWVANRSPRSERATALGVRLTGNRAALVVVPTVMGAIAGTAGITAIFIVVAVSLGVGTAVALAPSFDEPADQRRSIPEDR